MYFTDHANFIPRLVQIALELKVTMLARPTPVLAAQTKQPAQQHLKALTLTSQPLQTASPV
jgi:hypothetical protein